MPHKNVAIVVVNVNKVLIIIAENIFYPYNLFMLHQSGNCFKKKVHRHIFNFTLVNFLLLQELLHQRKCTCIVTITDDKISINVSGQWAMVSGPDSLQKKLSSVST